MKHFLRIILILLLFSITQPLQAQLYRKDPSFQPLQVKRNQGFLHQLILQPDGKIIIRGGYHFVNGQAAEGFNRLNPDGSVDSSFHPTSQIFTPLWVALRKDNKIAAANVYSRSNGKNAVTLFLLLPEGTIDSTFHTEIESGGVVSPEAFAVHSDNTIIVGTLTLEENKYKSTISRIQTDGSTLTLYKNTIGDTWISSLQFQPDGKILAAGIFPMADGSTKSLIRLQNNGEIDPSFQSLPYPAFPIPQALTLLPDGKMLISQYGSQLTQLQADGSVDGSFQMSPGDWNTVNKVLLQPDGKLLLSVWIDDKINYTSGHSKVVRLNIDGSLDIGFNCGEGAANYGISLMALQSNGDVLLGGLFNKFNGQIKVALARLKGNTGAMDTSFNTKLESNGHLDPLLLQPDGKMVVGGSFDIANDKLMSHIARLNVDGRIDTTFKIGTGVDGFWDINGGVINALALQSDGHILVGGSFTSFNKNKMASLLRLQPDGSVDPSFKSAVNEAYVVNSILIQPDGKMVIGASSLYNAHFNKILFRLHRDGSLDSSFKSEIEFSPSVTKIVAQRDGKLLIAGFVTKPSGEVSQVITRLLADGKLDSSFVTSSVSGGFYYPITSIVLQGDGKIMVGGGFTSFQDKPANKLVRLNTNGSIDPTFISSVTPNSDVSGVLIKGDGRLLIGGNFFNFGNRTLNKLTANGALEYSVFVSEELTIFRAQLQESGNELIVSGDSRAFRLIRELSDQLITFDSIPNQHPKASPFTINVSVNSNLPVTLTIIEGPATLSGNTVTLNGESGKVTIRASQMGNDFYKPAIHVERSFIVDEVLATENDLSQAITLFPNPAQGEFLLRMPNITHQTEVQLLNSQGKPVKVSFIKISDGLLVKTHQIPNGMYIIQIKLKEEVVTKKVVIQ